MGILDVDSLFTNIGLVFKRLLTFYTNTTLEKTEEVEVLFEIELMELLSLATIEPYFQASQWSGYGLTFRSDIG